MADGRSSNGGHKTAGRKPKAQEQKLIEKLTPLEPSALKALGDALKDGQGWAVKLFMEYMNGKPRQSIEQTNVNYNQELTPEDIKLINDELEEKY